MSAAHTPMVIAAARVLCKREAEQCNVDADDSWKVYSEDYLADAQSALDAVAAPDLLEALIALEVLFTPYASDSTQRDWIDKARAAIARAAGSAACGCRIGECESKTGVSCRMREEIASGSAS